MENLANFPNSQNLDNFNKFLVLGNNQDGCLLTGDKIDVKKFTLIENPFIKIINKKIKSFIISLNFDQIKLRPYFFFFNKNLN